MNGKVERTIDVGVQVDTEQLEDAKDLISEVKERLDSVVPNITIRNNQNVYVTINNFNATMREYFGEGEE